MTPEQEARRDALAWRFRCLRRVGLRERRVCEMDLHLRDDGSMIIEIRDPDDRRMPVHLERVLPDGTVEEDAYLPIMEYD
jgi:hypothetical protein